MVKAIRKVRWEKQATDLFLSAIDYIRRDSAKNAEKVKLDIISLAKAIPLHSEKYQLDKYKIDNDGTYRAFEKHHYRIVYRVLESEIRIISIRHTSMEPKEH
jgi:plasmid stabilization system protein ParE